MLAVGVGLEQAITASLRSAPEAIRPQVATLSARLSARWQTDAALRAFADDLDDATGDLVAASLILSAKRRGAGAGKLDGVIGAGEIVGDADHEACLALLRHADDGDDARPKLALGIVDEPAQVFRRHALKRAGVPLQPPWYLRALLQSCFLVALMTWLVRPALARRLKPWAMRDSDGDARVTRDD